MIFLDYFTQRAKLQSLEEKSSELLARLTADNQRINELEQENKRLKLGEMYGINPLLILSEHIPLFKIDETGEPTLQNMSPDEYREHLRQIHEANNEAVHYELDKMLAGINKQIIIDGINVDIKRQLMIFIVGLKTRFTTLSLKYRSEFLKEDQNKQKILTRSGTIIN